MTSTAVQTPTSISMVPFLSDFNILQQFLLGDCSREQKEEDQYSINPCIMSKSYQINKQGEKQV